MLSLNIGLNFLIKNLWERESFSHIRLIKEFPTKNWKRLTSKCAVYMSF